MHNLLTLAETAQRCKTSRRTVERWIKSGTLPHIKFSRAIRLRESDLEQFLQKFRRIGTGKSA